MSEPVSDTYTLPSVGPIPRTMAELEKENAELRQLLKTLWESIQSHGAYLIQQGQGLERTAVMVAKELGRVSEFVGQP